MSNVMRQPTLETLGLGSVLDMFVRGRPLIDAAAAVEKVFGPAESRGSLVISGANGIVGAGKTMQLGARLEPFGVVTVGLDLPGAPDGIGKQYPGLVRAFGKERAGRIMDNIVRLSYDGANLPPQLKSYAPRFLLEAIPEVLSIKKAHYALFKAAFPGIEIRSVTSGFPSKELGVGVAHPAFPHEINKVFETVEEEPSDITRMLWALGLIPIPVSDHWSFVLDVLFCGVTLAALRYHRASNMPFWKIDKFVRRLLGPNPFRAHDVIGAKGSNFLTWSCLHHLWEKYGELFKPTPELIERKESGQNWYPLDHFRPLVDWSLDAGEEDEFESWILGPLFQMTALMLHERRGHPAHINAIGELCAQFRPGILAKLRGIGPDTAIARVEAYHRLHPEAATSAWYPDAFERLEEPEFRQLYVNAEHDGRAGVITLSRESYNSDVDAELNRAIDWLKGEGIDRVIVTGDFHLSTQMVGADISEFFPALSNAEEGVRISSAWSTTARRLADEFTISVGFINGKRCLGGMLELMMHCHYVLAQEGASLGMPEVTLPVVPGMEGCHWPFRKADRGSWARLVELLLTGRQVNAKEAVGWLIDFAGPMDSCLAAAWELVNGRSTLPLRKLQRDPLPAIAAFDLPETDEPSIEAARKAIMETIQASCSAPLSDALSIQARLSGDFMQSAWCRKGRVGQEFDRIM